jgi:hypothetical protein
MTAIEKSHVQKIGERLLDMTQKINYGSVSVTLVIHEGMVSKLEFAATEKIKEAQ